MSNQAATRSDLDAYIATFDEEERQELAHADAALDLSLLLHAARTARGLTQKGAADRSGQTQQAISRRERSHPNMKLETLREYLQALGYSLEIVVRDAETGEILGAEALASAS